jgi:hypothetical protein
VTQSNRIDIDALMKGGENSDSRKKARAYPKCPNCGHDWHGLECKTYHFEWSCACAGSHIEDAAIKAKMDPIQRAYAAAHSMFVMFQTLELP